MNSKDIQEILNDPAKLQEFADLNNLATLAAKEILKRLLEKPEVSEEANKYIWSDDSSADLKSYAAGEEKGYERGHEAGFIKGAFIGVLAVGSAVAAYVFSKK